VSVTKTIDASTKFKGISSASDIKTGKGAIVVSDGDTALRYVDPSRKMGNVTMFARHGCPFCERAKTMLTERGIPFEVIYLGEGITMNSVRAASGAAKVPQVFIEGKLIGGSDALQAFLDKKS